MEQHRKLFPLDISQRYYKSCPLLQMSPRLQDQSNWSKQSKAKWWYHGLRLQTRSSMTGFTTWCRSTTPPPESGKRWQTASSLTRTQPTTSSLGSSTISESMPRMTWAPQTHLSHLLGVPTATEVHAEFWIFMFHKHCYKKVLASWNFRICLRYQQIMQIVSLS